MKAHLICSDIPLKEGLNYYVACGDLVLRCAFVYMFDTDHSKEFLASLSAVTTCQQCYRKDLEERYVYGVVDREKLKTEEVAA